MKDLAHVAGGRAGAIVDGAPSGGRAAQPASSKISKQVANCFRA